MKGPIANQLAKTAVLIVMFSTAVFACSTWPTDAADELAWQVQVFAFIGSLLIVANASVLLLLRKRYWLGVFAGVGAVPVQFVLVAVTIIFGDSCLDMTHRFVRAEVILLSILLIAQIGTHHLLGRSARLK